MKKTCAQASNDMLPEYNFNYANAQKNRFSPIEENNRTIILDPDVAIFFSSSKSVNNILRAIIDSMPKNEAREAIK